ncbi:alcohol acetyltransferase, partial [Mycena polygramma]
MPSDSHIRFIGLLERFHTTRNFLGLDSCVVAAARYSTQDLRPLTEDVIFPALREVIKAHPPLCVKLKNEFSSNPSFTRLHTIDLSRVVEFGGAESLQATLETQLARGFNTDADLPLWRIQVLADNTVIFAVHHVIGDGLSTIAFHTSLLRALRNLTVADASSFVRISDTLFLSPPIEAVTTMWPSLSTMFNELYKLFAPRYWTRAQSAWSGNPVPKAGSLRTNVRLLSIPAQDLTVFCAKCRTHCATLTSAFYILTVTIISRMLAGHSRHQTISSAVAISLRGVTGIPDCAICDCVSAHFTYPLTNPKFSWTAAARYAATLRKQKTKARENIGMLRFLFGHYVPYMRSHVGTKRASGFALSNLGCFDAPVVEEGSWNIVNTVFAQCDVVIGAAFKLNVVRDPAGALSIALTYGEHSIDSSFVESFMSQFRDAFYDLLS